MVKGIRPAPKKKKPKRLSEHARLVEERARSIPPGVVHELFDTSALPVPPPAPSRHPPGRLVSKPPPPPPRPSHRPEDAVEPGFAELEEEEGLEELEELDVSEESQTDGFGTHSAPPAPGVASGARRPWLRTRLLPAVLGAVVVGGLGWATARELGRSTAAAGVAPKTAPVAAAVAPTRAVTPPVADTPPPAASEAPSASPASEVAEASRTPADAPNAAVVAVSPDAVSVAASNAVLPATSGAARSALPTKPAGLAAFDAAVADAAIRAAFQRAQGCRSTGDPKGLATVTLTYAPSGRTTTALVSGIFAGTPAGSCIAAALRSARIPPFAGALVSVKRSATLQ